MTQFDSDFWREEAQTFVSVMNRRFADIITEGKIKAIKPTVEERRDNDQLNLARVAFAFNRRDYGRLRQLIDVVNDS